MNLGELFKQAKELQDRAEVLQNRIASIEVVGESGAGLVRVALSGKGDLNRVSIDPSLVQADQATTVEDLLIAAHADAKAKLERRLAEEIKSTTGGLSLPPGFRL
jgi:DNA-binding YbaB/EbfC family protein